MSHTSGLGRVAFSPTLLSSASDFTSLEGRVTEAATSQGSYQSVAGRPQVHNEPSSIAAAVKTCRGNTPARAMPSTRRGGLAGQTGAHQAIAGNHLNQFCRSGPQGSLHLPKAASSGTDLTLLGHSRPKPSQGRSEFLSKYQATPHGPLNVDELRASPINVSVQMLDILSRQQVQAYHHGMTRPPVSLKAGGQTDNPATGPVTTSSSSHCSVLLSLDSMERESWEQVRFRIWHGCAWLMYASWWISWRPSCPPACMHARISVHDGCCFHTILFKSG